MNINQYGNGQRPSTAVFEGNAIHGTKDVNRAIAFWHTGLVSFQYRYFEGYLGVLVNKCVTPVAFSIGP